MPKLRNSSANYFFNKNFIHNKLITGHFFLVSFISESVRMLQNYLTDIFPYTAYLQKLKP